MTTPPADAAAMATLSMVIASHATGQHCTVTSLAANFSVSHTTAMRHRAQLVAHGLITLVNGPNGALRLVPTPDALRLDLPPPPALAPEGRSRRHRPCMRCSRTFLSDGPHHRHCDPCRRHLTDAAGATAF